MFRGTTQRKNACPFLESLRGPKNIMVGCRNYSQFGESNGKKFKV